MVHYQYVSCMFTRSSLLSFVAPLGNLSYTRCSSSRSRGDDDVESRNESETLSDVRDLYQSLHSSAPTATATASTLALAHAQASDHSFSIGNNTAALSLSISSEPLFLTSISSAPSSPIATGSVFSGHHASLRTVSFELPMRVLSDLQRERGGHVHHGDEDEDEVGNRCVTSPTDDDVTAYALEQTEKSAAPSVWEPGPETPRSQSRHRRGVRPSRPRSPESFKHRCLLCLVCLPCYSFAALLRLFCCACSKYSCMRRCRCNCDDDHDDPSVTDESAAPSSQSADKQEFSSAATRSSPSPTTYQCLQWPLSTEECLRAALCMPMPNSKSARCAVRAPIVIDHDDIDHNDSDQEHAVFAIAPTGVSRVETEEPASADADAGLHLSPIPSV